MEPFFILTFMGLIFIILAMYSSSNDLKRRNKQLETENDKYKEALSSKSSELQVKEATLKEKEKRLGFDKFQLDKESDEFEFLKDITRSNLRAIPYMARIIADFDTRNLDILAHQLDWGYDQQRLKKVKSIRQIKQETKEQLSHYKEAEYQLAYAMKLFPSLEEYLLTDFSNLPPMNLSSLDASHHDSVRDYLSKEEYDNLSATERSQLALDRYKHSHKKSSWQIGRDYENYVGYRYSLKGYAIDYYGSYNGLEDLGRDLIATKDGLTLIIQCKYWSSKKEIHEKHINQLYGTTICYCLENNIDPQTVKGILVTNIKLSSTAKRFADYLGIEVVENLSLGDYPCIKCNINKDQFGNLTKIYHLPFDQQYDSCKINAPGEFFALTVAEAEDAGFRRAYRWHSNS